jgi:hypothetical protein
MGGQAAQLQELMEFFKIETQKHGIGSPAARPRQAPAPAPAAPRPLRPMALATVDGDFERF